MRLIAGLDYKELVYGQKDNQNPIQSTPGIYMDILHAPKFYYDLAQKSVTSDNGKEKWSIGEYLQRQCKHPWWDFSDNSDLYKLMASHIKFEQSIKTGMITIQGTAQIPEIAPQMVKAAVDQLQRFMTTYKTRKAQQEYQYFLTQRQESGHAYHEAQRAFARYSDSNFDSEEFSVNIKKEALQKEVDLAFNRYDDATKMCQRALMKIQRSAPVFVYVTRPYTPTSSHSPHYFANALTWLFFGWLITWWWQLYQIKFKRHEQR